MNKRDKKKFIRELCNSVKNDILAKVAQMPDQWDGVELRAYIADTFDRSRMVKMDKGRERDYRNTIYTTNL